MSWTLNYILSQVFSMLCFTCFGITFFSKNQKNIRFLGILMNVFQAISYMFLNAASGWTMLLIATIRNIVFFKLNKQEYTTSYKYLLFGLLTVIAVTGAVTYTNIFSLLPVFAIVLYSIGVWQKSSKIYKLLSIPNCLLWVMYNLSVASIVASIDEFVMLILAVIGFANELKVNKKVIILGAGLSGCETALQLANSGIKVNLYEMKPLKYTTAHKSEFLAELVCSNSLGKDSKETANGVLINECKMLNSYLLEIAEQYKLTNNNELIVNREKFSQEITKKILEHPNIKVNKEIIKKLPNDGIVVVATGPLTDKILADSFKTKFGDNNLTFQDSTCPIIYANSINMNNKQIKEVKDNLEISLTKEQFEKLVDKLQTAKIKTNNDDKVIELPQCSPIEYLAKKNIKTLLDIKFSQTQKRTNDNYATVTLRKENDNAYSIAGFMTQMSHLSQKEIINSIPSLENCEFARFGRSHKNTFLNAPKLLNKFFKTKDNYYIIGQLSGIDGYVPAIATGIIASYSIINNLKGKKLIDFPDSTMLGGFCKYITTKNKDFSPMVASFHLIKKSRNYYESSLKSLKKWLNENK